MRTRDEIIKIAVARLLDVFQAFERSDAPSTPEPEPEPAPKVSRFKPGTQEWFRQLAPSRTDRGVDMNDMLRSIPKPKPPRRPGTQIERWNGLWWHT